MWPEANGARRLRTKTDVLGNSCCSPEIAVVRKYRLESYQNFGEKIVFVSVDNVGHTRPIQQEIGSRSDLGFYLEIRTQSEVLEKTPEILRRLRRSEMPSRILQKLPRERYYCFLGYYESNSTDFSRIYCSLGLGFSPENRARNSLLGKLRRSWRSQKLARIIFKLLRENCDCFCC